MQQRGYSLVEMVVVVGVMSILLSIGTLKFNEYSNRYRSENQLRMIYTELMKARGNAIYQRRVVRVKVLPSVFQVYSSETDDTLGASPVLRQELRFPVVENIVGSHVDFDERGVTSNRGAICVETGGETGAVDGVVIDDLRLRLGKREPGKECNGDNIR
jgi:prepilin-type N-terminal cleavage/methylation domain-containing protein